MGVSLRDVKRRLNEVEAHADERTVDKPIAHVIEFGAKKCKEQQHAERFRKFLDRGRSKRSAQEKRTLRTKILANLWVLRQPPLDPENYSSVDRQGDSGRDDRSPHDGDGKEPGRLALPPIEVSQDENRNDGKSR